MIRKYRKLPVVIEAVQWMYINDDEIKDFAGDNAEFKYTITTPFPFEVTNKHPKHHHYNVRLYIHTLEGVMEASMGDYIIKGVNGEFYACKPDVFFKTYEEVE